MHGQKIEIDVFNGNPGPLMKSPFEFQQHGQSGAWVCEQYPHVARHVDDIAFLKSCYSESNDHVPALYQMNTGHPASRLPAAGSWVTYGLGSENQNLPGYVVLGNTQGIKGGPLNWGAGFLPDAYQGTLFRSQGSPILNLAAPRRRPTTTSGPQLDLLARLNGEHLEPSRGEADLLAAHPVVRAGLPHADGGDGPRRPLAGTGGDAAACTGSTNPQSRSFGKKCLMARRLVERGVRFVQVYSDGEWDAHNDLAGNHAGHCAATDLPIDGLLTDLKRRGLLDSTLVIWGGEFGRMPVSQGNNGRDHNPHGFLVWMAGGGIKGGVSHGETDEIGYKAAADPVSVHDLHATMLHLLGIDHKRLTYLHNGRRID